MKWTWEWLYRTQPGGIAPPVQTNLTHTCSLCLFSSLAAQTNNSDHRSDAGRQRTSGSSKTTRCHEGGRAHMRACCLCLSGSTSHTHSLSLSLSLSHTHTHTHTHTPSRHSVSFQSLPPPRPHITVGTTHVDTMTRACGPTVHVGSHAFLSRLGMEPQ